MFKFIPPKKIRHVQENFNLGPSAISDEQYAEVRARFKKISSSDPVVSVVIIAWNEEVNLFKTLVSLSFTQSKYPIEFIVVDNNSTDATADIIQKCGVRYVLQKNQGYAYARQGGCEAARGQFILSGDADTLYPSKWAEKLAAPLENPEIVCTYGLHVFYTEDGKYPLSLLAYQQAKTWGVHFRHLRRPHLNCGGASMGFSKKAWQEVGGYNVKQIRGSDGLMAFDLAKVGKISKVSHRKAMIYTSMRRTEMDGSLGKAFLERASRYFRNFFKYLTPQKE